MNLLNQKYKIKKDKYRVIRGGTSELLDLNCAKCSARVMIYQKDGNGALIRTYINRIHWPQDLKELCNINEVHKLENLVCKQCKSLIGIPMKYEDGRLAYRLIRGTFSKTKHSD